VRLSARASILFLVAAAALSSCTAPAPTPPPARPAVSVPVSPPASTVQTATLTGLYESVVAMRRNQLCMVERPGRISFGLVTGGGGTASCSGSGRALRQGDRLLLTMEGESSCLIDARIVGGRVTLPGLLPTGCSYYCAPGAPLAGASFDKTGGSDADALRAQDLTGGPLCG